MSKIDAAAQNELDNITKLFHVSDDDLFQITKAFGDAYGHGLQVPYQPVVMAPSFVTEKANGTEKGTFLTLEICWDSFVVSRIDLDGKRSFTSVSKDFEISQSMMTADANVFFDYLANSVKEFLAENLIQENLLLGFIFPFAVQKTSLDHGKLLAWSKGFSITGLFGQDPATFLQNALDKVGSGVKVASLINDTVAALLSESYLSAPCIMSVIYGAGTNGAYVEPVAGIKKLPQLTGDKMLINTNWGALTDRNVLKPNVYDGKVDQAAVNSGAFMFQKMTSWFYLGETVRVVLLSLVESKLLFNGLATDPLKKYQGLSSYHSFLIEDAKDLDTIKDIISEVLEYSKNAILDQDAEIVRQVCTIIAVRGGKLAACPIAALLIHQGHASLGTNKGGSGSKLPMATDGELFIGSAQFTSRLNKSLGIIIGEEVTKRIEFIMVKEGGIVGGAIAAYQATK